MGRFTGLIGIALIVAIGVALSRDRRAIRWSVVAWGLGLQLAFALLVLRVDRGLSFEECGESLGAEPAAVRKRFERLKERLKSLAKERGLLDR